MSDKDQILEIFFREYDKLKSEQAQHGMIGTVCQISKLTKNGLNYH